jgi:hypothetical protein
MLGMHRFGARHCFFIQLAQDQPATGRGNRAKIQSGNAFDRITGYVQGNPSPLPVASQHSWVFRAPSRNSRSGRPPKFQSLIRR